MPKSMRLKPLRGDLKKYIKFHNLTQKWEKVSNLFETNPQHPSLNVELLEPRWRGIYSFRLDRQYRALFFISGSEAEIFQITKHYRKT